MKNKGQTTVFFSLMISVLLLFTLTALEVGRIYMSKVKVQAVVHSAQTSILADYNRELFELASNILPTVIRVRIIAADSK